MRKYDRTRARYNFNLLLGLLIIFAIYGCGAGKNPTHTEVIEHYVKAGETWWDIAAGYKKQYGDERDLREIIYDSKKLTGSDSWIIRPGQIISIEIKTKQDQ